MRATLPEAPNGAEALRSPVERMQAAGAIVGEFATLDIDTLRSREFRISTHYQIDLGRGVDPDRVWGLMKASGLARATPDNTYWPDHVEIDFQDNAKVELARTPVDQEMDPFGVGGGSTVNVSFTTEGSSISVRNSGGHSFVTHNGQQVDPERPSEEFLKDFEDLAHRVEPLTWGLTHSSGN